MRTGRERLIARNIAVRLLSGVWTERAMARRLEAVLPRRTAKAQRQLVAEIVAAHRGLYPPSTAKLARLIADQPSFDRVVSPLLRRHGALLALALALDPPRFAPTTVLPDLEVPPLPTPGDVARWLGLPLEQLDWFTDERRQHGRTRIPDLQHYTYAFRAKRIGPPRLIEAPKPRLMTMQRRILHAILDHVPAHPAAHGFVKGRSCVTGAALHMGASVVVGFDIADFFLTTPLGRVHALFRSLGYPHSAARVLTRLCSTVTPESVFDRIPSERRHTRAALRAYTAPHLPQGAPTSPALANLVAWRLDVRLTGLAAALGGRYSRYADDLTFSGDDAFAEKTASLIEAVTDIVEDEGWLLNERKTRVMAASRRQHVTGIVVNTHLNVGRDDYDRLKAILHNCRTHGLAHENRQGHPDFRAHLAGRIGWVESLNPARGRKLRAMLAAIG